MSEQELDEIEQRHKRGETFWLTDAPPDHCTFCTALETITWPCDAVRAVEEVRRLREEEVNWRVQVDGFRSEVERLHGAVDRAMHENPSVVRNIIAHEIGQTVIDGFVHAGLSGVDAMYTALHMARELPYERLRLKWQKTGIPTERPDTLVP
jgi:hypothetical protein